MADQVKLTNAQKKNLTPSQQKALKRVLARQQQDAADKATLDKAGVAYDEGGSTAVPPNLPFIGNQPGGVAWNPITGQRLGGKPVTIQDAQGQPKTVSKPVYIGTQGHEVPFDADAYAAGLAIDPAGLTNYTPKVEYPHYVEGDEYSLIELSSDPDKYIKLQHEMLQAGLYADSANIVEGVVGMDDVTAYYKLLANANVNYSDAESTLDQLKNHPIITPPRKREALVLHLSNPDDIKMVARDAVSKLYGGGDVDESTYQSIIDTIHSSETSAQQTNYDLSGGEPTVGGKTAGAYTQPISMEAASEKILKERNPDQVTATRFGDAMKNVMSTLISGPLGETNF